jgi:septum formation protein
MTAVAIADRHDVLSTLVVTDVTFRYLSQHDICDYIADGRADG